ncbi:type IV pilus modification PilV family protein [Aquabacterium sp.]|uniref:type IV pilus modification PilV family protein n=1 Tax=Aquabacterium sp. TaxID=1872578 RepID=UPI002BBF9F11|nr:prepilin-type N-terminal cleavage/methylation domain-containing protein [Aquabacterium sp.]HSW07905.1 prepilin-type N-terminal cleavage/methylation domain-containing protein [Aquabacterium sp.]
MSHRPKFSQRGVTLIEALIAMAVMAFGMLALVGVQTTLRVNADLAKQRAEATRIAEQEIEELRSFVTVADYDNLALAPGAQTITLPESNTTYTLSRQMFGQADGLHRTVKVMVSWDDRQGQERHVILRDVLARAAPVLSGLVSAVKKVTIAGQSKNRHPTIPVRAGDLGNQTSGFKPTEGGTVAWVFNNTTGVITSVCVVVVGTSSSTLTTSDLSGCEATNAQLLAGFVRFNLRGVSQDLLNGTSVYKPVPGGEVAYVIDNTLKQVISRCSVAAAKTSLTLTTADLTTCTALAPPQTIATFDAADPAGYTLVAGDSEDPRWPALNLDVDLAHDGSDPVAGHTKAPRCFADSPATSAAANSQSTVQYFCIIYPRNDGTNAWAGTSTVVPLAFSEGNSANWSVGAAADAYRVCRYTPSTNQYADNPDHPAIYSKWTAGCGTAAGTPACRMVTGNLINQNFLVIEGSKTCPTDVAVNPAAGDLVNTNTLQHQP